MNQKPNFSKSAQNFIRSALISLALFAASPLSWAQVGGALSKVDEFVATDTHIPEPGSVLYATIGVKQKKIADSASAAWIVDKGHKVVFASTDGAGGFEGEGQGLHIYDVRTGEQRKIMSEYFVIDSVLDVKIDSVSHALVVTMHDGGLGAPHFAIVDPDRGEVIYKSNARIAGIYGDKVKIGYYKDSDFISGSGGTDAHPYKYEMIDLKKITRLPVIRNRVLEK